MNYNRKLCIDFANIARDRPGDIEEMFDKFLDGLEKPEPKPEPEPGICKQVLEAAAEMCGVSMHELSSGMKYGAIPSCKQLTAKILNELKCSDVTIASKLPQMGTVGTIRSRREAAAKYQKVEKNYRVCLNQLRERFGLLDNVHKQL